VERSWALGFESCRQLELQKGTGLFARFSHNTGCIDGDSLSRSRLASRLIR
jgi:hypothetical protein